MSISKVTKFIAIAVGVLACMSGTQAIAQCTEQQKLTASDASLGAEFGASVSVSGDTALVGSRFDACTDGFDCGAVYVYRFDGTNWVEEQKLTASDAGANDFFGYSVSVSGNTAVVGALGDDCTTGFECGSAYIYQFNGTSWVEEQKLAASNSVWIHRFGRSVAVSGGTVVVGHPGDDCAGTPFGQCGAAYVYRFNGISWVEEQKLTASDANLSSTFGHAVFVIKNTLIVGAQRDSCEGLFSNCGASYVFRFNGTSWVEEQKLTASDAAAQDLFGSSVSVSEDTAVVGAWGNDCAAGSNCGSAYLFRFNGNAWVEEQKLTAINAHAWSRFGGSVSVSLNAVMVGADQDDCTADIDDNCGLAYLFRFDGLSWIEEQKPTASDAAASDFFGSSVFVSGDTAIVGAVHDTCTGGIGCGSAYVFDLAHPCLSCGNGNIDPNEECDDGNTQPGDGCDGNCQFELGACCVSTACSNITQADCLVAAGIFFGFNSTCNAPDADGDGLRDECDACPNDSNKIEPGICGCGKNDNVDSDSDGITDCLDRCFGADDSIFVPECVGAIPAVSEWGLIVMTLLLLTGIKLIMFGGQQLKPI